MERFVDLPTPFTPTMDITYGRGFCSDKGDGVVTESISRRRSSEFVGVRIFLSDDSIADCILACTPMMMGSVYALNKNGETDFRSFRS